MSLNIWNRRYTGSKYKLVSWITELIEKHCEGSSFCDMFAGTGVVSANMIPIMKKIYINDFLYSNEIIYKAFFDAKEYDKQKINEYTNKYASVKANSLQENYISENFGNNFFSYNDAKLIGYIRDDIEANSHKFNSKEKEILITSLLYSADKSANTVGHYEAYIKGKEIVDKFKFLAINPYQNIKSETIISREDANQLAKDISCDITYIDPPYNSRQYSRFYHVLENITCWKKPELFGVALKPEPENLSEYCRSTATKTFDDLIRNLQTNYIVVSYNNTYASKSSSSRNKIEYESLVQILERVGELQVFEKDHQCFNAGKTVFNNHKEYIFIVKVKK